MWEKTKKCLKEIHANFKDFCVNVMACLLALSIALIVVVSGCTLLTVLVLFILKLTGFKV